MSNFRNIRNDGVQKVSNAAERLALIPSDGYLVEQLDDNSIWAWNQATASWIQVAGPGTGDVTSVFGRTGDVIAQTGDYTAAQVGAVSLTGNESVDGIKSFTSYPEGPGTSPTTDAQLVDKAYVDLLVTTGARFVDAVLAATTAPLPANTYNNGVSGVGATLTGNVNGALADIDGITPVLNGKYLIKDEATQANNGAYLLTQVGDGSNPYILTRLNDYNESSEIVGGTFFTVIGGSQANQQWAMNNAATITVGTTAITFAQLSVAPTITASLGVQKVGNDVRANLDAAGAITLSGNSMLVNVDNASIERNANALRVKALGVTNAMLAGSIADSKLSTITTAGKVRGSALTILSGVPGAAGVIPVANGSTGNSSYAIGDILYATGATTLSKLGIGSNGKVLGVTAGLPSWIDQTGGGGGGLSTIYYSKSLSTNSTPISVSNSVTETTIYTYTVPANQLGTDKIVQGIVEGTYLNNSAANRTVRVRVKYGATTILDKTSGALGTSATTGTFSINFYLANQGATNVQQAYMDCSFESGANVSSDFTDRGVAAIDSTTSQNLVVTVTLTNATATQTITKRLATLNMLNAQDDVGGVLLQTDGVDNGLQTTLNLEAGTGIVLTDDGLGTVTIDSSGGGVVLGDPATGFTPGAIQYIDQAGNQAEDSQFTRDSVTRETLIASDIPAAYASDPDSLAPFGLIADVKGDAGNSISLTFDGVDDVDTVVGAWNAANPSNTVTVAAGGVSVPDAQTVTLSGGGTTQFISGSLAGGRIFGSGFQTQDVTNDIDNIFATGNLSGFLSAPHGNAFFIIDNINNFLSGITQTINSNTMIALDLGAFSYFSSVEVNSQAASLTFLDTVTNSGFFAEPNNKTYIMSNSNKIIFPQSGGSVNDVLVISSQIGQETQLAFSAPSSGVAGSDTEIQFNNSGAFGASSAFTFNTSTNIFKVQGSDGLYLDTANNVYEFGVIDNNGSNSFIQFDKTSRYASMNAQVPVFSLISFTGTGTNDLSFSSASYNGTGSATITWDIEIDSQAVESGTIFDGAGLNDGIFSGTYSGTGNDIIRVVIDGNAGPDTFEWFLNGVSQASGVTITGAAQSLVDGISITFTATSGHTIGDSTDSAFGFGAVEFVGSSFSGALTQYEVVTGSISGATANVGYSNSGSGQLILTNISAGGFVVGDILTGSISGQTAQIDSLLRINDTFDWTSNGVLFHPQTPINAVNSPYTLNNGVTIEWASVDGHDVGDQFSFYVSPQAGIKLLLDNRADDNAIRIGDPSNAFGGSFPSILDFNLKTSITNFQGKDIRIGDPSNVNNGGGINISDTANLVKILQGGNDYLFADFSTSNLNLGESALTVTRKGGLVEAEIDLFSYGTTNSVAPTNFFHGVAGSSGATTFNLDGTYVVGQVFEFKDVGFDASTSNITIDAGTGNVIIGFTSAQTYVISGDGESIRIKKISSTQWVVL